MDAPHTSPLPLQPFTVVVVNRARKRSRYVAIARSWYEAWQEAIEQFGMAALISVRPAIRRADFLPRKP